MNDFKFDPSQRELIGDVAKHLRNVGYIWAAVSIFSMIIEFFNLLEYLARVHPVSVLDVFKKPMEDRQFFELVKTFLKEPFYTISGILAVKSARFFHKIALDQGEDLENLFGGFDQLRNALYLLYLFAIIFVIVLWIRILFF